MTLAKRITTLEGLVPRGRKGRPVPDDPVAFGRALLAREFGPADIDPTHPGHTGWLTRVYVFFTTLLPEHLEWLTATGAETSGLNSEGLAALDALMGQG